MKRADLIMGIVVAVMVIAGIAVCIASRGDDINDRCKGHDGISRIDYPYVICRDGKAVER